MAGDLQQAGAPAALVHLARGVGRVAVDRLEMIGDVAVGVVLQLAAQLRRPRRAPSPPRARSCRSTRADAPVVEAQLIVGIPVGRPDPAAEVPGDARDAERRVRPASAASVDLISAASCRRHPLVGVERQNPVVARDRRGVVLLRRRSRATRGRRRDRCAGARSPRCRRCSRESTTTISSAHATDASAAPMSAASFLVMTVTESFGTRAECTCGRVGQVGREVRAGRAGLRDGGTRSGLPPYCPILPCCLLLSRDVCPSGSLPLPGDR